MEQLLREMAGAPKEQKIKVLRGLMQCVGPDGRATRDCEVHFALGAILTVPRGEVIGAVKALAENVR